MTTIAAQPGVNPLFPQAATAPTAAPAGGAQPAAAGTGAAGASDFGGKLQQLLQMIQALAAQLGGGAGAQAQGPFMPGAPNPADAGPAANGQAGAKAAAPAVGTGGAPGTPAATQPAGQGAGQ